MGLGIALVAARYAKVDVLVHDANDKALAKSLSFLGLPSILCNRLALGLLSSGIRHTAGKGCQKGETVK